MIVKILQWNIWYEEDPRNVAGLIKRINPDIACLQEVTTGFHQNIDVIQTICDVMSGADVNYKQAQSWKTKSGVNRGQGNAIFSKYPIKKSFFNYLQSELFNTTHFDKEGRIYIEITVFIEGKELTIGTTHLSYIHRFIDTKAKNKQIDKLEERINQKHNNYVLLGDFNSPPDSLVIERIRNYLINCGPNFKHKTWTTKPFIEGDFIENKLNWRLDYAFSTKDVNVINTEIIQTEFSDHLPLLVTIEV